MNWLVTWLSCPGLEVSGHIIHTFLTCLTCHRYVPTHNYKHSLKVNYYATYACSCVSLENHRLLQLRSANRRWCGEIRRCLEFLDDCAETEVFEVLTASECKQCKLDQLVQVVKIYSRTQCSISIFVWIYCTCIYAHIFIPKICFCYAYRSAGDFYKLVGRAGGRMIPDGYVLSMCCLKLRHCFERGRSEFLRNPSDMELFQFKSSKNIFQFLEISRHISIWWHCIADS